ncbi:nitrilase-related carbon-nitrogen hydrolase [Ancylomarina longa]|uniref:CN hydrolase domain-containing protein n=1 Tax=Ancylomarina longa TaxID=2487017 RepID=A0A434AVT4_9BACT|nr:nitrilase-related carbon-nitrogen hydrolase [Ancylomarina longa]RUT78493.1 hypothetical protein DLK05_07915 [Ancylomarina longa]
MKIAVIQFAPAFGNLNATIEKLKVLFLQAKGADLIVLPELANSGYNFESKLQAMEFSETAEESIYLEFLQKQCKEYNFVIASGFLEREAVDLYNSAIIIDTNGIIGKYRKLHLFMKEKLIFKAGNLGLPIFELNGVKIGMLVCFDWMFPEVWRKMALKGVDLILHPSNLVLPYAQTVIPSYALLNRIFIATANRIGLEKELKFTGQSVIVNTRGEILSRASQSESILIADINPLEARNKKITPLNDAFEDRRTDIYE